MDLYSIFSTIFILAFLISACYLLYLLIPRLKDQHEWNQHERAERRKRRADFLKRKREERDKRWRASQERRREEYRRRREAESKRREQIYQRRKADRQALNGKYGEDKLVFEIQSLFEKDMLFQNVYVPRGADYSEIDIVALHSTGVYIFESKNFNGYITGDIDAKNWSYTHVGGKRYQFYNPLFQNKSHINALKDALNISESSIEPYVVFGSEGKIGGIRGKTTAPIYHIDDIRIKVAADLVSKESIFTPEELGKIKALMREWVEISEEERGRHIQRVKEKKELSNN